MSVLKIKNENNEWVSIPAIKGEDGIGILRTEINNDGELTITYSDKSTTNLGKIAGIDGVSIINSEINSDGELILTYSNNTIKNLGVVVGSNGEDGLGISKVEINEDGELEITYTNGNLINLGSVVGEGSQNVIIDPTYNPESENPQSGKAVAEAISNNNEILATKTELNAKQDTLVSGTNIKTVNGQSILGNGDITISGGTTETVDQTYNPDSENPQSGKAVNEAIKSRDHDIDSVISDMSRLKTDVYGEIDIPATPNEPVLTYIFDSDTDTYGDNGFGVTGNDYKDGKKHIPKFDVHGDFTVRIYEFKQNGSTSVTVVYIVQWDSEGNFITGTRQKISFYPVSDNGEVITINLPNGYPATDLTYIERGQSGNTYHQISKNGFVCTITPDVNAAKVAIFNIDPEWTIDIKVWHGIANDDPALNADNENGDLEPANLIVRVDQLEDEVDDLKYTLENFNSEQTYNIIDGNEALVNTVFAQKTSGRYHITDFSAVVIADMHGEFVSLDDAAQLRDTLATNAIIINAGDIINQKTKANGEIDPEVGEYMEKAIQHCVYHTMGQHEVGWSNTQTGSGMLKENCMTHEEVFNTFIAPMREVWGLPDLDTIYYYKDFPNSNYSPSDTRHNNQGTRLISLYQYNVPLVEDETDNTRYKYNRRTVWLGQEQINWLINTLNSTPDGYRVIILQHQLERDLEDAKEGSVFHDSETQYMQITSFANAPVKDIVQAYIKKTTFNGTYTAGTVNGITYPDDLFTVTVNADFTNANGEFAHYLSGDTHIDFVGYVRGTTPKQKHIVLTACNQSYDCYVSPTANNASRSIVNLMGYEDDFVRLGRVGQQYSMSGQTRIFEKVTLTELPTATE